VDDVEDAALDVAVSHALLREAADRGAEALRVWTPPAAVSFGRLDLLSAHSAAAVEAARRHGLAPVRRLAGGRAAAIGPGTVCLGWAHPSPEMTGMQERYEALADVIVEALDRLGIPARLGELAGEWCPGAWSVIAGSGKVAGLAQRVVRGGAWAEAVVVVSGAGALARALDPVQAALGLEWDRRTLAELTGVEPAQVRAALIETLQARRQLVCSPLSERLETLAAELRAEHVL